MPSFFGRRSRNRKSPRKFAKRTYTLELLEHRSLLTTFSVVNLNDSGAGSFRQAVLDANSHIGADTIDFDVAGTISLKSALATITDTVNIDGTSAPGYATAPVVAIDFGAKNGLKLMSGASGSAIRSLSLTNAANSGLKLDGASEVLIVGNYIGLKLDGSTISANRDYGIELVSATAVTIGGDQAGERNVVSGNKKEGVHLSKSSGVLVQGNYIGTDATGTLDRGNTRSGVIISDSSAANLIGGAVGNVISGNDEDGIKLKNKATGNSVSGNIIGLNAAGTAALGNKLDGIKIDDATNNVIGHVDPLTGIDYFDTSGINVPVKGWQGLRAGETAGEYLIVGTSDAYALLYVGDIEGTSGTPYTFEYPSGGGNTTYNTSAYGPNLLQNGDIQIVGSYKNTDYQTAAVEVNGFLYEGEISDLALQDPSKYRTINFAGAKYNFVHSTAGGLVVGNYDSPPDHGSYGLPFGPGHAYIYDIDSDTFIEDIHYPGSLSNSAYGIWHNGGTSYTIVGGYSTSPVENFSDQQVPLGKAYMVDYDSATGEFTHWTSFEYPYGDDVVTHFEGISSVEKGVYTINAQSASIGASDPLAGSWVSVRRNTDGSFTAEAWVDLQYVDPNTGEPVEGVTTSDSVIGNQVVGIVISDDPIISYQATINTGFQLSNVISGNGDNGIELIKASNNTISMNYIGTDITGTFDLGNASNGILVSSSSTANMIGGEATGGNDPTGATFVRPPQGNLISGNNANGVLINSKSTGNQLSGNFIGTDVTGNVALGNAKDGVLIDGANGNSLIGCTFEQDPFVFYNVLSGNLGNGLRVNNSNDTTIQANFFGLGADNDTPLGNALNGVLVEGSSAHTLMGGLIPLGNVSAANGQNGVLIQGKVSDFIGFNTFTGVSAFGAQTDLGNGGDGFQVTATGSGILLRTNVVSMNADDGFEISGKAKGVQLFDNVIGLNWDGQYDQGNGDNGVEIGGSASNILVGGTVPDEFSVSVRNTISGNDGYGVAIIGKAKNNTINHSFIGTDVFGQVALGNTNSGVYVGSGTSGNTIGSTEFILRTVISGNGSDGIVLEETTGNTVIGTHIGTDTTGTVDLANGANGIYITSSSKNTIGGTATGEGNLIAFNPNGGVFVQSGNQNGLFQNSINNNGPAGILLGEGANNNQAPPVLTAVDPQLGGLDITGTMTGKAKTTYILEFFASDHDDASGQYYLGSITVKTDSSGVAEFEASVLSAPIGSDFITATATDPSNNTSEFSASLSLQ